MTKTTFFNDDEFAPAEASTPKPRKKRIEVLKIEEWLKPDNLELLTCWARDGYTNQEIAEKMGYSARRLELHRAQFPDLDKAIRCGKEVVDYKVESALYNAAIGMKIKESKVTIVRRDGVVVSTVGTSIEREIPPNVLACQTWLFNRQRDKWKRDRSNEISLEDDRSISITIKRAEERIEVEGQEES